MRAQVPETEVAAVVVRHLHRLGADVYQEVEVSGGVADIVAKVRAELQHVVARDPGLTLKLAIGEIKHHYSSAAGARQHLATWIRDGKVPGVEMRDGGLWPTEAA